MNVGELNNNNKISNKRKEKEKMFKRQLFFV